MQRKKRRREQNRAAQRTRRKKSVAIIVYVSKRLKAWILKIGKGYKGGQAGYLRDLIERDKQAREGISAETIDDKPQT
jgi:hypothetical protein